MIRYFLFIFSLVFVVIKPFCVAASGFSSSPLIVLDPGHGGLDVGAKVHSPYCEEKRLALTTAHYVKKYLENLGYRVILTRSRDFFVPLKKRAYIANKAGCHLFVSLHFNSCPNNKAHGMEIFYCGKANKQRNILSKKAAQLVLASASKRTNFTSRGVKSSNFCVIRETKMPAILIEGGFLTNEKERLQIRQRACLDKLARGVCEGIHNYMKQTRK